MPNSYFDAQLIELRKINLLAFTFISRSQNIEIKLFKDGQFDQLLRVAHLVSKEALFLYELELQKDFEFGHQYYIEINDYPTIHVKTSSFCDSHQFDELFNYDGDDLGSIYHQEETSFALWSPISEKVILKLEKDEGFEYFSMERSERGVYRKTIKGDLLNKKYSYIVFNDGNEKETLDPYAKGTSFNSLYSAVVDVDKIKNKPHIKPTNNINNYVDSIIYELNVRDFSEDKNTNIKNKGKYLGLIEENRLTKSHHPAGIDYLKYLGITHIQLQPVLDFANVDDIDHQNQYNWGYDPISFFSIEGSYSINPYIPMARLEEFREMVDILHKNNIRVVLDVVYNHIFEYKTSSLEKSVPNYYFRKRKNGGVAKASGCGNDIDSERFMVSKMIVDSLKYLTSVFDVDGFRFDLMGLIDIDTINKGVEACLEIKKDMMFYGEGWNMGVELSNEKKASIENADKLNKVSFFNDTFRDIVKGPTFERNKKGFASGDFSYCFGLDYAIHGCILPLSYKEKFNNANQSVNYIECHDNQTLYDKFNECVANEDSILDRVSLASGITMLSFGVPFIHMGQEIGLSKKSLDNTYNIPHINNLDYSLVDERFNLVERFRFLSFMRKKLPFTSLFNKEDIQNCFEIHHYDNNLYVLKSKVKDFIKPYESLVIVYNITDSNQTFIFDDYYSLLTDSKKEFIKCKNCIIGPCQLQIWVK